VWSGKSIVMQLGISRPTHIKRNYFICSEFSKGNFLRAIYYFDLVRMYGGVPLWTKSSIDRSEIMRPLQEFVWSGKSIVMQLGISRPTHIKRNYFICSEFICYEGIKRCNAVIDMPSDAVSADLHNSMIMQARLTEPIVIVQEFVWSGKSIVMQLGISRPTHIKRNYFKCGSS